MENTYGIPFLDETNQVQQVYNSAGVKGFFQSGGTKGNWGRSN